MKIRIEAELDDYESTTAEVTLEKTELDTQIWLGFECESFYPAVLL